MIQPLDEILRLSARCWVCDDCYGSEDACATCLAKDELVESLGCDGLDSEETLYDD